MSLIFDVRCSLHKSLPVSPAVFDLPSLLYHGKNQFILILLIYLLFIIRRYSRMDISANREGARVMECPEFCGFCGVSATVSVDM